MKNAIRIVLTYACDKHCAFCYQKSFNKKVISKLKLKKILEHLNLAYAYDHITVMGGEVSLIKDFKEYLLIIRKIFPLTKLEVITNGEDFNFYNMLYENIDKIVVSNLKLAHVLHKCSEKEKLRVNIFEDDVSVNKMKEWLSEFREITVCSDIRLNKTEFPDYNGFFKNRINDYTMEYSNEHGKFRYVLHTDYNHDNWIVLPSGRITDNFQDMIDGK